MKICKACKTGKSPEEFSKNVRSKDGFNSSCKKCNAAYYAANCERIKNSQAIYRQSNPENIRLSRKAYYLANREEILASNAVWAALNREKVNAVVASWAQENPEKVKAARHNRRSREINAEGSHTAADIRSIFERKQGLCANCQVNLFKSGIKKFHVDHVMPLALGGSNWPGNLQCLCPTCNLSKGAKHPDEWAKQQGRLL